jgi:type II secretory pathway pseudopilin PulG
VELLVVLGMVVVLSGFLWPAFSASVQKAEASAELSNMRQLQMLIDVYCGQNDEVYPRATDTLSLCHRFWYSTMVEAGVAEPFERQEDISMYEGVLATAAYTSLTAAAVLDWRQMIPGETVYVDPSDIDGPDSFGSLSTIDVRRTSVRSASGKGILSPWHVRAGVTTGSWCCFAELQPKGAVSFADGSAAELSWPELLGERDDLYLENGIGGPVFSTWYGIRGRDR